MKRSINSATASLNALGIVVALGAVAHAALPYLPLIGPPPLRVQAVKKPGVTTIKFEPPAAAAAPTNSPVNTGAKEDFSSVYGTNIIMTAGGPGFANIPGDPSGFEPEMPGGPQSLGDTFTSSIFTLPTPDLLGISPQMLSTYFRPGQNGTRTAVGTEPFRVSFVPPLPPEKSGHPEHNVK